MIHGDAGETWGDAMTKLVAFFGAMMALLLVLASPAIAQNITPLPEGGVPLAPSTSSASTAQFSAAERSEIGEIVREYLLENPEVIVEVLRILQDPQQQAQRPQRTPQLAATEDIVDPDRDPVVGNPNASVTVVEFFDYQCPICKRVASIVARLTREDDDVVVFKEFPVFGEASVFAARASLAADKQGKYEDFHVELLKSRKRLSERVVLRLAKRVGLDVDQLRTDMAAPEIEETIRNNYQLARQLGLSGTPSFVIGGEVIPGGLDYVTMRRLVQAQRKR